MYQKPPVSATTVELCIESSENFTTYGGGWAVWRAKYCSKPCDTGQKNFQWPQKFKLHLTDFSSIKVFTFPWKTRNFLIPSFKTIISGYSVTVLSRSIIRLGAHAKNMLICNKWGQPFLEGKRNDAGMWRQFVVYLHSWADSDSHPGSWCLW